jgi:Protein of unknown function (DUF3309)
MTGLAVAPPLRSARRNESKDQTMRLILLILLILLIVGALPAWPYSGGWGYYPSGGLGLLLIVLLILALF